MCYEKIDERYFQGGQAAKGAPEYVPPSFIEEAECISCNFGSEGSELSAVV